MPKQTFLNLPAEKRENIVGAAIDEFAQYGFENASINRIVAHSGIAKGSFYQYFEDKRDVFKYLIAVLEREKTEYFKDKHPPSGNLDLFAYFRWMMTVGLEFNASYPRLAQAVSRVLFGEGLYYGTQFAEIRAKTTRALTAMIKEAIKRGEVDPSVEVDLAVMIMETWSAAISVYIMNEGTNKKNVLKWARSAKTQTTIAKMLYVMEYGLRKTESQFVAKL
jgi:AcrR family transcriptional regulator